MSNSQEFYISINQVDDQKPPPIENTAFELIAERLLSRRQFIATNTAFGISAFVMGTTGLLPGETQASSRLEFIAVPSNSLDNVTVPPGYNWHVLSSWGNKLWSDGKDFDPQTRGTKSSQELAMGDSNDGMSLFEYQGRSVLAVNNESVRLGIMYGNRASGKAENSDDIGKGKAGHGVTICEIAQIADRWQIVENSYFNRRITADTPMQISGPALGHDLLKTSADPHGIESLGTFSNCGCGQTPWGTYLTCEENFNGYFSSSDGNIELSVEQERYGLEHNDRGYSWARIDQRFDFSKHPNEPHRMGYVVEIDPLDPQSIPRKRTALGRFKHENAEVVISADGHIVVYMGDDERSEFLYRFVSNGKYEEGGDNLELLDNGELSAAVFDESGQGEWRALTPESTGMSSAEIAVFTRFAASKVHATTMDRPEWVAAHPYRSEVYCALTNNKNRGDDETPAGGPNPRERNKYGQVVRWRPENDNHGASRFQWDLFVLAGNPVVHHNEDAGSANITPHNMFNSPDGLAFDSNGLLWIQTDGKYSNRGDFSGMGNNQMLVGDPDTGEIKRFMVGPKECEITGLCWSHDRRTMFVGIQHPGANGNGHFPDGDDSVPRSSIVAIRRDDKGLIG
ncbi:MAG: secreted PhoX family phosphatase [Parasphingorhabdus sp.]|jgi:secreted PhoX family phosphatase